MSTPMDHPSPRETNLFTQGWLFRRGLEDSGSVVDLPHDAMIGERRSADAATANHGGYFPGGRYVYTKQWQAPADSEGREFTLHFEGVYGDTVVSVNGHQAAHWNSGYREMSVPLTDFVVAGESLSIEVTVDNTSVPNSRWYTGSGIYRPVWLESTLPTRFATDGVRVVTRSVGDPACVTVSTVAVGDLSPAARVTVELSDGGTVVARGEQDIEQLAAVVDIAVPSPRLWSAETPHLYDITVTLVDGDDVVDEYRDRVGLRTLTVDARRGLRVNGETVRLRGACVHHDNGVLGAATHAAAEHRRARILKENGFNAIRSSHNPLSRAFLDACDELGLYVMDELTDVWFQPKTAHDDATRFDSHWRDDLDAMIAKDRNRASVIMYSIGNEVAETATPRGITTTAELAAHAAELDPERPTTLAINFMLNLMASYGTSPFRTEEKAPARKPKSAATSTAANLVAARIGPLMQQVARVPRADKYSRDALAGVDVAGYNYAFLRYARDRQRYPQRVILGTESMPGDLAAIWRLVESVPGVIGDFMWTGWDYLGEAGIGSWSYDGTSSMTKPYPELIAGAGAIDILGIPGAPSMLARAVWGQLDSPAIAVRPLDRAGVKVVTTPWRSSDAIASWAWAGYEGTPAEIEVYSSDDEIELVLNGRTLGRKPGGSRTDYVTRFSAPYRSGTLTAIGYRNGIETGRSQLHSAGTATLTLRVEPLESAPSSSENIWYVWVELADTNGTVESAAYDEITVELNGGGTIEGFGSAATATTQSFTDPVNDTYYGRSLLVVRGHDATTPTVTARSRRHGSATAHLE